MWSVRAVGLRACFDPFLNPASYYGTLQNTPKTSRCSARDLPVLPWGSVIESAANLADPHPCSTEDKISNNSTSYVFTAASPWLTQCPKSYLSSRFVLETQHHRSLDFLYHLPKCWLIKWPFILFPVFVFVDVQLCSRHLFHAHSQCLRKYNLACISQS